MKNYEKIGVSGILCFWSGPDAERPWAVQRQREHLDRNGDVVMRNRCPLRVWDLDPVFGTMCNLFLGQPEEN